MMAQKFKILLFATSTEPSLCRCTREVVAYAVDGRGAEACEKFKKSIPPAYAHAQTVSDFWEAYKQVFGEAHSFYRAESLNSRPPMLLICCKL